MVGLHVTLIVIVLICGTPSLLYLCGLLRSSHVGSGIYMELLYKFLGDGLALLDIFRSEALLHEPDVVLDEVAVCVEGCNHVLLQNGFLWKRSALSGYVDAVVGLLVIS